MVKLFAILLVAIPLSLYGPQQFLPKRTSAFTAAPAGTGLLTNLLVWYNCDEASGNLLDQHTSGINLTDVATVTAGTGKIGGARDFERDNGEYFYQSTGDDFEATGSISVSAWINVESLSLTRDICGVRGNSAATSAWVVRVATDNQLEVSVWNTSDASKVMDHETVGISSTGVWYHVVATIDIDNNLVNLWVNSTAMGAEAFTGPARSVTAYDFAVGGRNSSTIRMDGLIDELGIWRGRVLTQDDVNLLYNSGNGRTYTDL
jgi:hypothetical protein